MSDHSYLTFQFAKLTDRARVSISDQQFTIQYNGVGISSTSGTITLKSLSISSNVLEIVPTGPTTAIADISVRVYVVNKDGGELPLYIGGDLSIPSGSTFTVHVDNGGEAQFTSDNNDWSVKTRA
jgi:hypothetical protein